MNIPNYELLEKIYESEKTLVFRTIRKKDKQATVLKVMKGDNPSAEQLVRYRQGYEITCLLSNVEGVVKPYTIEKIENTLMICMEDFGGYSLRTLQALRTFSFSELLSFAIQVSKILGEIHTHHIIHKDLNPANLLVNPDTGELKVIDFGISTQLSKQHLTLQNPEVLEGTLAYISPEQTGRMNRSLDYRTDFYSLGATFYELFTGKVPFEKMDVLELMHCHIAKQPIPPHELNAELPLAISSIIMKLLEKTAETRYQSSWGITTDLEACQSQLTQTGQITAFSLGQHDFSERFQLLQKLYGREQEIDFLLAGFERVAAGNREMMLIAGYSGIGKSALVREIYKALTEKRGYFIKGKFDQLQRSIPYSAVVNAFKELVQQLLTENAQKLAIWKKKLLAALGVNGQVIIDLVPELEQIIGQQPPVDQLGSTESQNRFNIVIQNFMHVFCQSGHPLVVFLDDLQWVDSATLKLLELVMTDQENTSLYLIGAYRDNEVSPIHPLMTTLDKLRDDNVVINQVILKPLAVEHISQLIAESLHHSRDAVGTLADLVMRKTHGNPFFISQFLQTLYEEELLKLVSPAATLAAQSQAWSWDIAQIEAMNITDNVVDLMVAKLAKLPNSAQNILRLAACIGNAFDIETLSVIYEKPIIETFQDLTPVLNDEFILPSSSLELSHGEIQSSPIVIRYFAFLHDRVQQAAYALIDDEQKQTLHLQIGRLLLANIKPKNITEKIFDIVFQFNKALTQISDAEEKLQIAELNLQASEKAKESTAYIPAYEYLQNAIHLLNEKAWQDHYDLAFAIHSALAQVAFLVADFQQMDKYIELVLNNATNTVDKLYGYDVRMQYLGALGKQTEALQLGLEALSLLNESLATELLESIEIEPLINLPKMQDAVKLAAMRILSMMVVPSWSTNPAVFEQVSLTMINLSYQYGNCEFSAFGYGCYGSILCAKMEVERGYQFGKIGVELVDKLNIKQFKVRVHMIFYASIMHWRKPLRDTLEPLYNAVQLGIDVGDLEYACYGLAEPDIYQFLMGANLEKLEHQYANSRSTIHKLKQDFPYNLLIPYYQATLNLLGKTEGKVADLDGAIFNKEKLISNFVQERQFTLCCAAYLAQTILAFIFRDCENAYQNALLSEKYKEGTGGMFFVVAHNFYYSLALLAKISSSPSASESLLKQVNQNQVELKRWASYAPTNSQHKYDLVEAEKARVLGEFLKAEELYEKAIVGAKENQYLNEEAVAYELAAEFYLARRMERVAKMYLKEAHYAYQQWEAIAKVNALETQYPQFLSSKTNHVVSATGFLSETQRISTSLQNGIQWLDLNSIMKAAQTLSGEIVLEQLLEKMMRIVIENAGAEKGSLLLPRDEQWFIEAEGHIDCETINVLQAIRIQEGVNLPVSLVTYVARTQESLVLNNASTDGLLVRDNYIKQHQTKSVLGLPLINQEQLIGILYLENNLTTDAFTADRLETLNLLSSQLAISIQNAKLYAEIQTKERTLTQFLEAVPVGIGILNRDRQIHYINSTGQQWLGQGVVNNGDSQPLSQTYQLYVAESEQVYPEEQLPVVRALYGERTHIDDIEIRHVERTIPIEAWGVPIYDHQGDILYAITTFLDISERRQAEANKLRLVQEQEAKNAALRYSAEIEAKNTELAATLQKLQQTQNKLIEAEKMASLGNLVAGVAHEINTPVGIGVTAATQLDNLTLDIAKHYKDGKMARSDLEQYLNSVHQTSNLILKNLTRAAELTKSFKSVAVDQASDEQRTIILRDYIHEVIMSLKPKFDNTDYHVSIECDADLQLTTSPGALAQILTNLITNSLQHGFAGRNQGHIYITAQYAGQSVLLKYCDDGKGIAPDVIDKIYEPFFTTDRAGGGSGLGMHIVYNLITHKLNGSIQCESVLGNGVCFMLHLSLSTTIK